MNLLDEALIRVDGRGESQGLSLPELYVALLADEIDSYSAQRRHQAPAWHMFLVQLGAIAIHRAGLAEPPQDAETWRAILRSLTAEEFPDDEPWRLVVADQNKPAFLQPPVPAGVELKKHRNAPDEIDMVITAKNHDLKQAVAAQHELDDWIFALVSIQTCEGFGGAGNYGVARMNGGSSSRVMMSLAPARLTDVEAAALRLGRRLARDLVALTRHRDAWRAGVEIPYDDASGLALLWTLEWPEGRQLRLDQLHPLFIEVCRRIRLGEESGRLFARLGTSKTARIAAKEQNGVLGDPWAPVHATENKSLTLGEDGAFDYRQMIKLLFDGDWSLPFLATPSPSETDPQDFVVVAEAFARGNSKTGGFRVRHLPIAGVAARSLRARRASLHELATEQVREIDEIERALRNGLTVATIGGANLNAAGKDDYAKAGPARARLRTEADRLFFSALWRRFAASEENDAPGAFEARKEFIGGLVNIAKRLLKEGLEDLPCAAIHRPRAIARGEAAFNATLWRRESAIRGALEALYSHEEKGADDDARAIS